MFTLFVATLFPGLVLVAPLVVHARMVDGSTIRARSIHTAGTTQPATTTYGSGCRPS
ncbi:MAG TPA: hypothetical protein QF905_04240 [Acidimicrobiales bacterium]|nr:hypothetical protein [Acidimicrobiales bacterium]MDP6214872.1 hypothetical protein [Acidimicrobiales bacterium]MDP7208827.1 hypothetical protein [Acidimicrobiales bacterium]HJL89526.1 hypothetical protein [Acidimicrobiales bacterium]HJO99857.1 hypothetical protein [Acidimicrobiales bacterium]